VRDTSDRAGLTGNGFRNLRQRMKGQSPRNADVVVR
jgi:hypothetical protein